MKIALIILLIFMIMLIAKAVSDQYKDKFDFYENLYNFLCQFKVNLSFRQEKLTEFLNNVTAKKQFNIFVEDYKNYLAGKEMDFDNLIFLEQEEKDNLKIIISDIGKNDAKTEIEQLNGFINTIETKKNQTEKDKNKICPLIIKLSLLFSIGLSILLI